MKVRDILKMLSEDGCVMTAYGLIRGLRGKNS